MKFNIPKKGVKYVFTENFNCGYIYTYNKGIKFIITKFNGHDVTFKIISTIEESMECLENFRKASVRSIKQDMKAIQFAIDLWNKDPKKFIIGNEIWKNDILTINTGNSYETIKTHMYYHKDNILNKYSYQDKCNEYYSKETYESFFLKAKKDLEFFESKNISQYKYLYSIFKKKSVVSFKKFNKVSFKRIKD